MNLKAIDRRFNAARGIRSPRRVDGKPRSRTRWHILKLRERNDPHHNRPSHCSPMPCGAGGDGVGCNERGLIVPPRKLDAVIGAMRAGQWNIAIQLAAKFPRLGAEEEDITRAREAILRPDFMRQLGKEPSALIEAGKAALLRRYPDGRN